MIVYRSKSGRLWYKYLIMNFSTRLIPYLRATLVVKPIRFYTYNSNNHGGFGIDPIRNNPHKLNYRCSSTSETDGNKSNGELSNELDTTDPDSTYAQINYEDKIVKDDTKLRDGIASSPDHFSTLDETEATDTIREKLTKRIGDMFTKK